MLTVGAARLPLPMPIGQPLAGYINRTGAAIGIHDDLFARAFVASDDREQICLLVLDTLCVDASFVAEARRQVAAATEIPAEAIMIAATHTHAGAGGVARFRLDPASDLVFGPPDPALTRAMHAVLVQAATRAAARLTPVTLYTGVGWTDAVARSRISADGPYDPAVPFLVAVGSDGTAVAAIYSFACHSTVLGAENRHYSGDLLGATCQFLEAHWDSDCVVLGLVGAAGDISTRFTRRESGFSEVARLAGLLAQAVWIADWQPSAEEGVVAQRTDISLAVNPPEGQAALKRRLEEAERRLAGFGDSEGPEKRVIQAEIEGIQVALRAGAGRPESVQTEVQLLRIGDTVLAGYPAEMFAAYGLATREALSSRHVLVAGCANDYVGYVLTPDVTSSYETSVAAVAPDSGWRLFEAMCNLARRDR